MTGLKQRLNSWLQRPIQRWIKRKLPPAASVQLGLSNIMILPTRLGVGLLGLIGLLFLLAINYENSMVFAICFALIAIWLLALHWTFHSLAGLTLSLKGTRHVHAGDDMGFDIEVAAADKRARYAIELFWQTEQTARFDVPANGCTLQQVFYPTKQRGYLQPERLQIVSYYPLMLFRAWSSVAFDCQPVVYPTPQPCPPTESAVASSKQTSQAQSSPGFDELSSVRPYHSADPLHHIAWKASAKRPTEWVSKQFEQQLDQRVWLNYHDMPGPTHEARISQLTHWCLQYQQQPIDFGVVLLNDKIEPSRGAKHLVQCLTKLALQPTGGSHAATAPR